MSEKAVLTLSEKVFMEGAREDPIVGWKARHRHPYSPAMN
jgi:hypothetical protein